MSENEPNSTDAGPEKPVIKPRKKFVPKKKMFKSDKPMEYRVRHIRLATLQAAQLVRQTILEYQNELAEKPMDDPDKEFADQDKVEKFFARLAKKYSACPTRSLGGNLDWVHNHQAVTEGTYADEHIKAQIESSVLTRELVGEIMKCERQKISGPIKSSLGFHIVLVCEVQFYVPVKEETVDKRSVVDDIHGNADHSGPKNWSSDVAPN